MSPTAPAAIDLTRPAEAASARVHWQMLTGEYPPQPGGVSDYSRLVARGLADAGDRVTVWAPPCDAPDEVYPGVDVRRLPDNFGRRSRWILDDDLDRLPGPRRLFVQYVPHAFGCKAANVPFCLWLRSRRRDSLWIMFHEVAYPRGAGYSLAENALSVVTRWMATTVGRAAQRIFVSIPAWQPLVESMVGSDASIQWMPVPSSVPFVCDPAGTALVRSRLAQGHPLIGHLGTYGRLIRPLLRACLPALLATTDCRILLLGRGGDGFRDELIGDHPELGGRIEAPGALSPDELSRHVSACDVMMQPYPDGISSRRTSVMVALSHGRPVVTTVGHLSEPFWAGCGAVVLVPPGDPAALSAATASLIRDRPRLIDLSARALAMYAERFDLVHTIARLRSADTQCTNAAGRAPQPTGAPELPCG
jgi:glycosyltransferase involved in cell wall biosynthesis